MATQKVKPDPGTVEGRVPGKTRGEAYAKVGAYGLVTVVFVVVAAAGSALWNSGRTPDPVALGRPSVAGPAETRPTETGPAETAPAPALVSAAPDVMRKGTCSGPSQSRLALTDVGDKIRVRFVIIFSLDQQPWRIVLRHGRAGSDPFNNGDGRVFFEDTRTGPYLSPNVAVRKSVADLEGDDGFAAKAVNQQTGQLCRVHTRIG